MKLTILVEPTAKGRPRGTVVDGHASFYTPARTRNAEALIVAMIRTQVIGLGTYEVGLPLRLEATFYRARPKHLPKRVTMPVSRPDVDNYFKLLGDALEHFLFANDSQITSLFVKKRFAEPGSAPRIELEITEDKESKSYERYFI